MYISSNFALSLNFLQMQKYRKNRSLVASAVATAADFDDIIERSTQDWSSLDTKNVPYVANSVLKNHLYVTLQTTSIAYTRQQKRFHFLVYYIAARAAKWLGSLEVCILEEDNAHSSGWRLIIHR